MTWTTLLNRIVSAVALSVSLLTSSALPAGVASDGGVDTRLPGVASVDQLADGAWVCSTFESVYVSTADPHVWELRETGLPRGSGVHRCAGGSQNRMYLVVQPAGMSNHDLVLYAVARGTKPARLRPLSGIDAAGFCSETTGVLSTGANVGVTVDGGATWHPTPPLFDAENAGIALLRWVDASRLLLSDGHVLDLYELQPGAKLRRLWRVTPPVDGGLWTRSCECDGKHVWLMGTDGFHRLKLEDGQQDRITPRSRIETAFRVVNGGLVTWGPGASKLRTVMERPDGTYTTGKWLALQVPCGLIPLANQHIIAFTVGGAAYGLEFPADSLTPVPLHVTPQWSKPADAESPETVALQRRVIDLSQQLPVAEVDAIGEGVLKRSDVTPVQRLALLAAGLQLAVDKRKAEGTLSPPRQMVVPPVEPIVGPPRENAASARFADAVRLSQQLPENEVQQVWAEAKLKAPSDPEKARQWVAGRLERLIAKRKADGTLRTPGADDLAPTADRAAPQPDQDALVGQILHLGLQLPGDEVKQVWGEARRKEPNPAKQRLWVKDQLEKLIAKHEADGTLPKPKSDPPDKK